MKTFIFTVFSLFLASMASFGQKNIQLTAAGSSCGAIDYYLVWGDIGIIPSGALDPGEEGKRIQGLMETWAKKNKLEISWENMIARTFIPQNPAEYNLASPMEITEYVFAFRIKVPATTNMVNFSSELHAFDYVKSRRTEAHAADEPALENQALELALQNGQKQALQIQKINNWDAATLQEVTVLYTETESFWDKVYNGWLAEKGTDVPPGKVCVRVELGLKFLGE